MTSREFADTCTALKPLTWVVAIVALGFFALWATPKVLNAVNESAARMRRGRVHSVDRM